MLGSNLWMVLQTFKLSPEHSSPPQITHLSFILSAIYEFARAAITKCYSLGDSNNGNLFLKHLEPENSKLGCGLG